MADRPQLIAVGQYCLGGVLSFYENLLNNDTRHLFKKKIILLNEKDKQGEEPIIRFNDTFFEIFDFYSKEDTATYAMRLEKHISNQPGVILVNFLPELASLHLFRKENKTIFYICHDELYYKNALKYSFLIDVYIAHNPAMFERLVELLPNRVIDIHYLPYGIELSPIEKIERRGKELHLVFLARHVISKGINDIPKINRLLLQAKVPVRWTIFGDGNDSTIFREKMNEFDNVVFKKYFDKLELYSYLKDTDILVHPSTIDGLPVAMLEAMSAGVVPVLYEFNEGIKKIISDEYGVVVPKGDFIQMTEAIIELFEKPFKLKSLSLSAIKMVNVQYNVKNQAELYYDLFSSYIGYKFPFKRKWIYYYHGYLNHPIVPKWLRKFVRYIKTIR